MIALLLAAVALMVSACGGLGRTQSSLQDTSGAQSRVIVLDDALAQLDALHCPQGANPEVFQQLKDAFAEALSEKAANKVISSPPTGEVNSVNDLGVTQGIGSTWKLTWHYKNAGDYNQDGIVNVADITPLASHFTEEVTGGDNSLQAVIDGSGDGKVNIADVTPIAAHFGSECTGYAVTSASAFFGTYQQVTIVPITSASASERKFCEAVVNTSAGTYFLVAPLDSANAAGEKSATGIAPGAAAPAKWHVMVFAGGDNSLNLAVIKDLNTFNSNFSSDENVGASYAADVNIWEEQTVVPYAGFSYIGSDHSKDIDLNPDIFNSADPANLTLYLNWVKANWPAEHYCLVMSDHGGSWTKNASGIMSDDTSAFGIQMEIPDMANVIRQSGLPVDVIAFEACNMASVEVMSDLVGVTDYVVASETTQVGGDGYPAYPLAPIANWLQASPAASAESLANEVSALYQLTYSGIDVSTTSSTIRLAAIPDLVSALADVTSSLEGLLDWKLGEILDVYEGTWRSGKSDGDIGDFLSGFSYHVVDEALKQKTIAAGTKLGNAVINNQICYAADDYSSEDVRYCTGLTIYMPLGNEYENGYRSQYQSLSFDESAGWSSFIDSLQPSINCQTLLGMEMGAYITWDTSNPGTWGPDLDLYLWEPILMMDSVLIGFQEGGTNNGWFESGLMGPLNAAYEVWISDARIQRGDYLFLARYVSDGIFEWSCNVSFESFIGGESFSQLGPYYLDDQTVYDFDLGPGWIAFAEGSFSRRTLGVQTPQPCTLREAGLSDEQIASIKQQVKQIEAISEVSE